MAGNWIQTTLGDVLTLQRGFDLPIQNRRSGTVPVVASTGIVGSHDEHLVKSPGVVIGRSGSIGGAQFITDDFWPLNTTLWVKDFKGNYPRFVYYLLSSIDFKGFNVGSGVPTLNRNHIHSLPVSIPSSYSEQKAIAHILGTLDDKIELNQQMNRNLEAIASAIFKSWFVDFDPVRAKMEGRQPVGMDSATAALFPDLFEDSLLGEIPKGWEVLPIIDLCSTFTDGSHYSPKGQEAGHYIATVKDMEEFDFLWNQLKRISDKDYEKLVSSGCKAEKGDILFSKDGTIGRVIIFNGSRHLVLLSSIAILRPKKDIPGNYLWAFMRLHSTKGTIMGGYVSGSALPRVVLKDLKKLPIIKPSNSILQKFSSIAEPLVLKIQSNQLECEQLYNIRDTLLPKLMSGEIRVKEAEKIVEAVA